MTPPANGSPLVTVVVPTRGTPGELGPTLEGLVSQRFAAFEVVVISDGGGPEVERLVRGFGDARLSYRWQEHAGRGAARNHGARLARGAYVCFFDADDIPGPDHLATAADTVARHAPPAFHLDFEVRTPDGALVRGATKRETRSVRDAVLGGNPFGTGGMFLERRLVQELPWTEDPAIVTSEDWLLWLQVAARTPILAVAGATWTVVEHPGRTFHHLTGEALSSAEENMCAALAQDEAFLRRWGQEAIARVRGRMVTTQALVHALKGERGPALKALLRAARLSPRELLDRRALAILRRVVAPGSRPR